MPERTYYVLCDDNCRFEGMTKEQIISAIAQATGAIPETIDVDAAFITKIKETNAGKEIKFWVGTTAQYNALQSKPLNTFYIFTDDPTAEQIKEMAEKINEFISGVQSVKNAVNALNAENAASADNAANADNADAVNNLAIERDENGVLKIGDVVIPQKKLIGDGNNGKAVLSEPLVINLNEGETLKNGDVFDIEWRQDYSHEKFISKCRVYKDGAQDFSELKIASISTSTSYDSASEQIKYNAIKIRPPMGTTSEINKLVIDGGYGVTLSENNGIAVFGGFAIRCDKIYKVIE